LARPIRYGFLPANDLARLLGCAHEPVDRGLGNLVTTRDRNGETSIPSVFVVGEAGAIGGAQIALAQGRLAGYKAAENLARSVPSAKRKAARRALSRHCRFQDAIWSLYHAPTLSLQLARDDTVICRCEEVTLGQLRPLIAAGVTGLGELKRLTRAGMGRSARAVIAPCPWPGSQPSTKASARTNSAASRPSPRSSRCLSPPWRWKSPSGAVMCRSRCRRREAPRPALTVE
jgi:NAD(P)H-nitrite reductase large subunit